MLTRLPFRSPPMLPQATDLRFIFIFLPLMLVILGTLLVILVFCLCADSRLGAWVACGYPFRVVSWISNRFCCVEGPTRHAQGILDRLWSVLTLHRLTSCT